MRSALRAVVVARPGLLPSSMCSHAPTQAWPSPWPSPSPSTSLLWPSSNNVYSSNRFYKSAAKSGAPQRRTAKPVKASRARPNSPKKLDLFEGDDDALAMDDDWDALERSDSNNNNNKRSSSPRSESRTGSELRVVHEDEGQGSLRVLSDEEEALSLVPPPRARFVSSSERSVTQEALRSVATKGKVELLQDKFNLTEPSDQQRSDVALTAQRVADLLTLPTAPAELRRRSRLSVLADPKESLEVFEARNGSSLHSLTKYARALAELGDYQRSEAALERMRQVGIRPDAAAYSAVLVSYARASKGANGAMSTRARALLKSFQLEHVSDVSSSGVVTPHLVSSFISVLSSDLAANAEGSLALDSAFELIEALRSKGAERSLTIETYTALIKGCVRVRDYARAWATFDHVRIWHGAKLKPDVVLYSLMIHVCAMTGEAERALNLLDEMRANDVYPTEVTYTALLGAFRFRPDMHVEALGVLRDMKGAGFAPDTRTYLALLAVMSSAGDHGTCELVFDELRRLDSDPSQSLERLSVSQWRDAYASMLRGYARALRRPGIARTKVASELIARGEALWTRAVSEIGSGVLDIHSANAYLRLFVEGGRVQRGVAFGDRIRSGDLTLLHDTRDSFDTRKLLLELLCRARRIERALDHVALMKADGYSLDVQCYSHLVTACARAHYTSSGMRLLREMHAQGLPMEPTHYYLRQFRRTLVKSPHLIREIDELTGKAREFLPGWKRPGGRKYKARMREDPKKVLALRAAEPAWPRPAQTHAMASSVGR